MLNQPPACLNAKSSRSLMPKSGPRSTPTSGTRVLRIAERPQQQRECLDLLGFGKGAGAADLHRDLQLLECLDARKKSLLLARENQEIAVGSAASVDLATDVPRDALGFDGRDLVFSTSSAMVRVQTPGTCGCLQRRRRLDSAP